MTAAALGEGQEARPAYADKGRGEGERGRESDFEDDGFDRVARHVLDQRESGVFRRDPEEFDDPLVWKDHSRQLPAGHERRRGVQALPLVVSGSNAHPLNDGASLACTAIMALTSLIKALVAAEVAFEGGGRSRICFIALETAVSHSGSLTAFSFDILEEDCAGVKSSTAWSIESVGSSADCLISASSALSFGILYTVTASAWHCLHEAVKTYTSGILRSRRSMLIRKLGSIFTTLQADSSLIGCGTFALLAFGGACHRDLQDTRR